MDKAVKYGLVIRYIPSKQTIAKRAYYKWLNGSNDDYKNWCDSVKEEIFKFWELNHEN